MSLLFLSILQQLLGYLSLLAQLDADLQQTIPANCYTHNCVHVVNIHNHITILDTTMTTGHRLTVSTNLQYRHQSSLCLPSFDTAAIYLFVSSVPAHREQGHTQSDQIFQHGCGFTYKNCFVLICDSTRTSRSVIRLSWLSSELGKKDTHLALFPDTPYRPIIC